VRKPSRKNPDALTDEETQFLRSERTPSAIRQFAARQHETIGVRTSAYRKVAAAARAEREALLEIVALQVVQAASSGTVQAQDRVAQLEDERRALEGQLENTRKQLLAATAAPAMAIHSEGTQR
jgi:hypothetical protein